MIDTTLKKIYIYIYLNYFSTLAQQSLFQDIRDPLLENAWSVANAGLQATFFLFSHREEMFSILHNFLRDTKAVLMHTYRLAANENCTGLILPLKAEIPSVKLYKRNI